MFAQALRSSLTWLWMLVRASFSRLGIGSAILALAAVIYLEPYFTGTLSCLSDVLGALTAGQPVEWACFEDLLDDLREDGTAATVILAVAAAILASGWSSGGSEGDREHRS